MSLQKVIILTFKYRKKARLFVTFWNSKLPVIILECNLKIQICQEKEQSVNQTKPKPEVHSPHEAMQETRRDNKSRCFATSSAKE